MSALWRHLPSWFQRRSATHGRKESHRICRPCLERLENRLAPAAHDTLSTAFPLALNSSQPAQVYGSLATPNQVDLYAVQLIAGDEVTADVSAQNLSTLQSYLRLFNPSGQQLAFAANTGSSSQTIVTFDAPASGVYYLGISSNGDSTYVPNSTDSGSGGLTTGGYTLTVVLNGSLLVVNSALDPATPAVGTLRCAVNQANTAAAHGISDTIVFDTRQMGTTTITVAQGFLELTAGTGTITIDGGGQMTLSGNNASTVFQVDNSAAAFFTGLSIQEGNAGSGNGGGIDNAGTLTVTNCTFSDNSASSGGAIENSGSMSVTNATFSTNLSSGFGGGGIYNAGTLTLSSSVFTGNTNSAVGNQGVMTISNTTLSGNYGAPTPGLVGFGGGIGNIGTLTVVNTTITGNFAAYGAGIYNGRTLLLANTIVAGNSAGFAPDIYGAVASTSTNNLIGDGSYLSGISNGDANLNQVGTSTAPINPLLGTLDNYGGTTQTMPLQVGSPALGTGGAVTSLSDAITDATSTAITVQDAAAIASSASNYLIQIDGEQLLVTNVDLLNNTLMVVRGVNGTSAATHSSGAGVYLATDQRGLTRSGTPDLGAFQTQGDTLTLSPAALPAPTARQPYSAIISAAGGSGNYDFTLAAGTLPSGLSLNTAGVLSGMATNFGTSKFIVLARDTLNSSLIGSVSYSLTVPPFPSPQPLNSSGTTDIAGTHVYGTTAYYSFTTTTTGGLSAAVIPVDETAFLPRLTLYGASGQLLIQSDAAASGSTAPQLRQHLQPGTYYLGVAAVTDAPLGDQSYMLATMFSQSLPPFQPVPVGGGPDSVAVGHFTHDGNLDIVTANSGYNSATGTYGPGTVSVLLGNGDGTFQSAVTYTVGLDPTSVAMGEFTNDGHLDIVTANSGDNSVSVLLGNGDGTFQPAVAYAVGSYPISVAVGGFTPDGHLDIVTANYGDNTVSVLLGNGDGTFQPAVAYAVGSAPISVAVGGFTPDGHLDIVTANYGDNTVSVLLGNGDGTFQPAVAYAVGSAPISVAVGGFTPDGHLDIVTANYGDNTVSVLLGNGDGAFQPAVAYAVGSYPTSVAVGDFNSDGKLDIVTANYGDNTVSVLLGNGDGTFQPAVAYAVGSYPISVAVGGFTPDGNLDIITTNEGSGTVSVLFGRGDGTFVPDAIDNVNVGVFPDAVAVGDFSHDRNLDIVTANLGSDTVSVLLGRGDGTFLPAVSYPVGNGTYSVAVGDFIDDGNLDIVTANSLDNTVSVLLGRGDGTFLPAVTYNVGDDPDSVAVGYFTHDGNLDIVTANSLDNTVSVLLGRGDGTFLPAVTYNVGDDPDSVAVGHFTNDGNLDIVTANSGDNTVSVLLGNGDGTFQPAVAYAVGGYPTSVAVGYFTHDGKLDIVTANSSSLVSTVSVLLGNGDGTFSPAVSYLVGSGPDSVAVGYFTHDGNLDIVTDSSANNTVSVLLGNGDGTFLHPVTYAVGGDPDAVAVGDFTNDGNFDIATANYGDSTVSVLLNQGNGQFQTSSPANGVTIRNVPFLQDLTGDGIPDELILNSAGDLLFRQGLSDSPDSFAPPVLINPNNPARDATVFQTADGWAVAAVDDAGNAVSIYSWDATTQSFQRSFGFTAGNLPVRVAASDLNDQEVNGHPLDDLVVANDFDNSVTIALQQADGTFTTLTRPTGAGPSDIAFANLGGENGPAIVVSDQVSGDFTVLLNDSTPTSEPTFCQEYRYRAGTGLFEIDESTGEQTVLSQLQTNGVVAADFVGSGSDDLVVVNRGARSFMLMPNQGQGSFTDPQAKNTYATSVLPAQIASLTLPGDTLPSVAILMEDLSQIWIYRNNGKGTFAAPTVVIAGADATGFSVTTVGGTLSLLVGNAQGDILTLLYDGHGGFAPDRPNLQNAALAVGTTSTGQQFAVVVDPKDDQVSLYYRISGTDQFRSPIVFNSIGQVPLLAPGAVQTFYVTGDPNAYLAVTYSLSNALVVYHFDPFTGQFVFVKKYQVGDGPVSVTVAYLNENGVPDLLVVNNGSNDVSVLIGSTSNGVWTATPGQRLLSGGSGPIEVAVQNSGGANGPNLLVTNSSGSVVLLPGIGANGVGSGFFRDINPQTFNLASTIVQSVYDSTTGQLFVVGGSGSVSVLGAAGLSQIVDGGVKFLSVLDKFFLVADLENGSVELLTERGGMLAEYNAGNAVIDLQALQDSNKLDLYLLYRGSDLPVVVPFAELFPNLPLQLDNGIVAQALGDLGEVTSIFLSGVGSNEFVAVEFAGGSSDILSDAGLVEHFGAFSGFIDQPNPLQLINDGVYLTYQGTELPTEISVFGSLGLGSAEDLAVAGSFVTFVIPISTQYSPAVAEGTHVQDSPLLLVAILLSGNLVEGLPGSATQTVPGQEVFGLFLSIQSLNGGGQDAPQVQNQRIEEAILIMPVPVVGAPPDASSWKTFKLGVTEALRQRLERQQAFEQLEDLLDVIQEVVDQFKGLLQAPAEPLNTSQGERPPSMELLPTVMTADQPDLKGDLRAETHAFLADPVSVNTEGASLDTSAAPIYFSGVRDWEEERYLLCAAIGGLMLSSHFDPLEEDALRADVHNECHLQRHWRPKAAVDGLEKHK